MFYLFKPLIVLFNVIIDISLFNNRVTQFFSCKAIVNILSIYLSIYLVSCLLNVVIGYSFSENGDQKSTKTLKLRKVSELLSRSLNFLDYHDDGKKKSRVFMLN